MTTAMPFRKTGIELTFMPRHWRRPLRPINDIRENVYCLQDRIVPWARRLKEALNRDGVEYLNCGTDPLVVEVSTYPYQKGGDLFANIERIIKSAHDLKMTDFTPWCTGGGAHVNVNRPDAATLNAIFYEMVMSPWIVWGFAHPGANKSMCGHLELVLSALGMHRQLHGQKKVKNLRSYKDLLDTFNFKNYATELRFVDHDDRLEFRFFPASMSVDRHQNHVRFAHALMTWCQNNQGAIAEQAAVSRPPRMPSGRRFELDMKDAIAKFENTIDKIGLDVADFKWCLLNIQNRFKMQARHPLGRFLV